MNTAKCVIERQYGNFNWNSYDNVLQRLRCTKNEQFTQITPTEDGVCDTPIFACKFSQQENYESLIALANEDGKLAIYDTNTQDRYGIQAHNNAVFDLAWMFTNMKIVTASGDHTTRLFDVSNSDIREIKSFYGHTRSVKTVTFRKDDPSVFATGGRDGNIIIWDTRVDVGSFIGKADRTIINPHNTNFTPNKPRRGCRCANAAASAGNSVTGLVFQDDNTLISCGAGDGVIKIWDLRKNYMFFRHEPAPKSRIPYAGSTNKSGYSSLIIDKNCTKLYASCLDNTIYSFNLNSYNPAPIMKYTGHQNSTFYVKACLSKCGSYLISGSSDENAYIWNTRNEAPFVRLTGHYAEVTCVAWCEQDDITIVTCSDDMSHKIWRIGTEDLPENWEITVKGKSEVFSLDLKNPLKRTTNVPPSTSKKLIVTCDRCDSPSTSKNCSSCTPSNKRKHLEEISNDSKRLHGEFGPRTLFQSNLQEDELTTALDDKLVNLPNYAIDGVAPHLNLSPPKKKSQDWLTKLRVEKSLKRKMQESSFSAPSPPKVKFETTRKCSSSGSQSPILRYFKVRCEGHACSSKTEAHPSLGLSPKTSQ